MRWQHKCEGRTTLSGKIIRVDGQWRSLGDWIRACPHCQKPNPYYQKPKCECKCHER